MIIWFFQSQSPTRADPNAGNWKISNLLRNNRSEPGGSGDSLAVPPGSEPQSQPGSNPGSTVASPAHGRKGLNLLPEVVRNYFFLRIFFKPLAPHCCVFESGQELRILSCEEAIQLAYLMTGFYSGARSYLK
jgi:hypothetical protein